MVQINNQKVTSLQFEHILSIASGGLGLYAWVPCAGLVPNGRLCCAKKATTKIDFIWAATQNKTKHNVSYGQLLTYTLCSTHSQTQNQSKGVLSQTEQAGWKNKCMSG